MGCLFSSAQPEFPSNHEYGHSFVHCVDDNDKVLFVICADCYILNLVYREKCNSLKVWGKSIFHEEDIRETVRKEIIKRLKKHWKSEHDSYKYRSDHYYSYLLSPRKEEEKIQHCNSCKRKCHCGKCVEDYGKTEEYEIPGDDSCSKCGHSAHGASGCSHVVYVTQVPVITGKKWGVEGFTYETKNVPSNTYCGCKNACNLPKIGFRHGYCRECIHLHLPSREPVCPVEPAHPDPRYYEKYYDEIPFEDVLLYFRRHRKQKNPILKEEPILKEDPILKDDKGKGEMY